MSTAEEKLAKIDELLRTGRPMYDGMLSARIREILNEDKFADTDNAFSVRLEISDGLTRTWQQVTCDEATVSLGVEGDKTVFTIKTPNYSLKKRVGI